MSRHLLFYDGECGLCDRAVQFVLKHDRKKEFIFAPLQGVTAVKELAQLPPELKTIDSLILLQDYGTPEQEITTHGRGAMRICWLLGGWWALIGWKSFLPSWPFDVAYRFVARNRHRLFSQACIVPDPEHRERFLP